MLRIEIRTCALHIQMIGVLSVRAPQTHPVAKQLVLACAVHVGMCIFTCTPVCTLACQIQPGSCSCAYMRMRGQAQCLRIPAEGLLLHAARRGTVLLDSELAVTGVARRQYGIVHKPGRRSPDPALSDVISTALH